MKNDRGKLGRKITANNNPRILEALIKQSTVSKLTEEVASTDTILIAQTPSDVDPSRLVGLFRSAKFSFVYDGKQNQAERTQRRKIMRHCVKGLLSQHVKVFTPGSIGALGYDVFELNGRKINADTLFHQLSDGGVSLQEGINAFTPKFKGHPSNRNGPPEEHIFFSSPRGVASLVRNFFVEQGVGYISCLGQTKRFVEIIRLYEVNAYDEGDIYQILRANQRERN